MTDATYTVLQGPHYEQHERGTYLDREAALARAAELHPITAHTSTFGDPTCETFVPRVVNEHGSIACAGSSDCPLFIVRRELGDSEVEDDGYIARRQASARAAWAVVARAAAAVGAEPWRSDLRQVGIEPRSYELFAVVGSQDGERSVRLPVDAALADEDPAAIDAAVGALTALLA